LKKKFTIVLALFMACAMVMSNTPQSAAQDDIVTVTFWSWLPTTVQWDEGMAKAFEAEHPNIKIDYTRSEDVLDKLQVAMASGTGPDIFGLKADATLLQYAPFCEPMDALADQYMPNWRTIISKTAVDQCTTADGITAGMPMLVVGMNYMLYNKTLMDEVGIDKVPATYAEMAEASQKARAHGYVSMAMGAADDWQNADWFVWLSNQFEKNAVYEAFEGKRSFTDQCFVDTLEAYAGFFQDGVFQDGALGVVTYPDARDQYFFDRKAIFFPTGSWHLGPTSPTNDEIQGTAIHNAGDIIGMSAIPAIGPEGFFATTGVDIMLCVNKDAANKEAAMIFIQFMAMGTGNQMWIDTLQGSPVANNITYQGAIDGPLQQQSIDEINRYNSTAIGPRTLNNAEIEKAIIVAMQNVATGADPAVELRTVQRVSESVNR